jgi:hypothetical protein
LTKQDRNVRESSVRAAVIVRHAKHVWAMDRRNALAFQSDVTLSKLDDVSSSARPKRKDSIGLARVSMGDTDNVTGTGDTIGVLNDCSGKSKTSTEANVFVDSMARFGLRCVDRVLAKDVPKSNKSVDGS